LKDDGNRSTRGKTIINCNYNYKSKIKEKKYKKIALTVRRDRHGQCEKSAFFRKIRQDLSGKLETSRLIMYSVQLCQFEPIQVSILFLQRSYPGDDYK